MPHNPKSPISIEFTQIDRGELEETIMRAMDAWVEELKNHSLVQAEKEQRLFDRMNEIYQWIDCDD